jgi:hypothetical protein
MKRKRRKREDHSSPYLQKRSHEKKLRGQGLGECVRKKVSHSLTPQPATVKTVQERRRLHP